MENLDSLRALVTLNSQLSIFNSKTLTQTNDYTG